MPHRSLMHWLLGTPDHHAQSENLQMRVSEAIRIGAETTVQTAARLLASSHVEKRQADEVVDDVRKRIARQEERRSDRERDPHISVIIDTIRIMRSPSR